MEDKNDKFQNIYSNYFTITTFHDSIKAVQNFGNITTFIKKFKQITRLILQMKRLIFTMVAKRQAPCQTVLKRQLSQQYKQLNFLDISVFKKCFLI